MERERQLCLVGAIPWLYGPDWLYLNCVINVRQMFDDETVTCRSRWSPEGFFSGRKTTRVRPFLGLINGSRRPTNCLGLNCASNYRNEYLRKTKKVFVLNFQLFGPESEYFSQRIDELELKIRGACCGSQRHFTTKADFWGGSRTFRTFLPRRLISKISDRDRFIDRKISTTLVNSRHW